MPNGTPTFEVLARLGAGGMGEVFLAVMRRDGTELRVALKRLRADSGPVSEKYPLFEREARICSLLQHPNVVRLEAYGYDATGPFLALELVDGRSVSSLLREYGRLEEPLPLNAALCIARDAALGLQYAHEQGVVHRDVSPDNVLVSYDGLSKVTDFGIAKLVGGETLTSTGIVVGKYGYLAPELFDGKKASVASDVFSYAATLYRLLSGVPAFPGRTEAEMVRAVLSTEPVPLSQVREVPAELAKWIHAGLAKKPQSRPASMADAVAVLDAELSGPAEAHHAEVRACMERAWPKEDQRRTDLSLPALKLATATVRKQRTWLIPAMLGGAAVAAFGVGAAIALSKPSQEPQPQPEPPRVALDAGVTIAEPADAGTPIETPQPTVDAGRPQKAVAPRKPGKLLVLSFQYVRIYVDGFLRGDTPMSKPLDLPSGRHQVRVVNEKLGFDKTFDVVIEPGAVKELKVRLP